MKSRDGKSQWEEKSRREKSRRERVRRKKMQMREKVGKSRNTVFFQRFVAPEGRKVGSLKRRVRSHVARWEMKNCTPLRRETHFEVKMYKTHHARKLRCRKSARHCGVKHISKSKCTKHTTYGPLLDVQFSFRVAGARDCAPCQKWAKREIFCGISKNDGRRGTFEEDLQRCISSGRRSTKDMFMRDVGRSGRWFPESGCILEHQICRFAKMILRGRCSTSYDLASFFRGRRSTLDRWSGKIAKRIGTRLSELHSTFHFWRKSRRIALFLMLPSSTIEEVSPNCFVLDVVKFKKRRRLAELLSFQACR